jgi:hypothetical protein
MPLYTTTGNVGGLFYHPTPSKTHSLSAPHYDRVRTAKRHLNDIIHLLSRTPPPPLDSILFSPSLASIEGLMPS